MWLELRKKLMLVNMCLTTLIFHTKMICSMDITRVATAVVMTSISKPISVSPKRRVDRIPDLVYTAIAVPNLNLNEINAFTERINTREKNNRYLQECHFLDFHQ